MTENYKPDQIKHVDFQIIAEAIVRMAPVYRAPYVSVIGYSDALLEGLSGDLSEEQRADIEAIRIGGWEALGHLNDVLDVMLITSGEIEYNPQLINASQLVQDIKRDFMRTHVNHSSQIETHINTQSPLFFEGDEKRLRQMWLGIIANAMQTVKDGKVVVTLEQDSNYVQIGLRDACAVVSPDDYTYFFEPGWVCKLDHNSWRHMQWQSFLMHQMVLAFDGEVAVSGVEGDDHYPAGTLITVRFPLKTSAPDDQSLQP